MTALATILADLESRCRAATKGPWDICDGTIVQTKHITRDVWTIPRVEGDLAHIASWSPDRALRFLALAEVAVALINNNWDAVTATLYRDRLRTALAAALEE